MNRGRRPAIRRVGHVHDDGQTVTIRYGGPCDCCQPWTFDELAATVRFFADVAALAQTS